MKNKKKMNEKVKGEVCDMGQLTFMSLRQKVRHAGSRNFLAEKRFRTTKK